MRLIIIAYHHVTKHQPTEDSRLYIDVASLDRQIKYLMELQIPIISTTYEISHYCRSAKTCVMLTFDDGYESFYRYAFPVLKKYNVPALLFISTAKIGLRLFEEDYSSYQSYVSIRQIDEMLESGLVIIQPHGYSHTPLGEVSDKIQINEIEKSIACIKEISSLSTDFFCLPYGSFNESTIRFLNDGNVKFVLTTKYGDNIFASPDMSRTRLLRRFAFKPSENLETFNRVIVNL